MDPVSKGHLETSSARYERVADTFKLAAEKQFGLTIPDETHELWKHTLNAARRLDVLLDEDDGTDFSQREDVYRQAVDYVGGQASSFNSQNIDLNESVHSLQAQTEGLSEKSRRFYGDTLHSILRVTKQIKTTDSAYELARLTRLEGQLTARLFSVTLSSEESSAKQRDFSHWLTRVGRFANVFDTAVDLKRDYATTETKVMPTLANRAKLLWYSKADLLEIIPKLRLPLIASLGKSVVGTLKGRTFTYRNYGKPTPEEARHRELHLILDERLTEKLSFDALIQGETPSEYLTDALVVRQIIDEARDLGAETTIHYPDGTDLSLDDALIRLNTTQE